MSNAELYEEIGRLHMKINELSESEDRWYKRYQDTAKERDKLQKENATLREEAAANAWYIDDLKSQIEDRKPKKIESEGMDVDARREEEKLLDAVMENPLDALETLIPAPKVG